MHDSLKLKASGIPTVAVATTEFRTAARAQADAALEEIVGRLTRA